jgi:hypothetical protein
MTFQIISIIEAPESQERTEIDNIPNKVDALYFLDCKRDMEGTKPGTIIEKKSEESFRALTPKGEKVIFAVKEKP